MKRTFNVNGLTIDASYTEREVKDIFLPLLNQMTERFREKKRRVIVYLAAPPGTGKTTLSLFLEELYAKQDFPYRFQVVSIDGFHHRRKYLMNHWTVVDGVEMPLNSVKGSPESFDLEALTERIQILAKEDAIEWPVYDRSLHDVSEEKIQVDAEIVLIEGNYLMLDEPGWKELKPEADLTIFIETEEETLRPRLVDRKMMGGLPLSEAEAFYDQSDGRNVVRVLEHSSNADIRLKMTKDNKYIRL